MRRFYALAASLPLIACTPDPGVQAAPGKTLAAAAASTPGLPPLEKVVYVGTRRLQGPLPVAEDAATVRRVEARLFFHVQGGGRLTLHLAEQGSGPFRVKVQVPGRRDADGGWSGSDATTRVRIDPRGVLTGAGEDGPFRILFNGKLADARASLRVVFEATGAAGKFPAGTRFTYDYDLPRRDAVAGSGTPTPGNGQCRKIRWKLKTVMDYSGGGVDTVRVPVCEN